MVPRGLAMGTRLLLLGLLAQLAVATSVPAAGHGPGSTPPTIAHSPAAIAEESAGHHPPAAPPPAATSAEASPESPSHAVGPSPPPTTRPARQTLVQRHGPLVPLAFTVGLLALIGSLYARSRNTAPSSVASASSSRSARSGT